MQVFIVGTPIETAMALDARRLRKQIIETTVILDALSGAKAWSNHPCVLQYRGHEAWLEHYLNCLVAYENRAYDFAKVASMLADQSRPDWHCQSYYDQMKRRLHTKSPAHYKQWRHYGTSEENYYYVDGEWRKYVNGKRIE